jgi:hypothetical protein
LALIRSMEAQPTYFARLHGRVYAVGHQACLWGVVFDRVNEEVGAALHAAVAASGRPVKVTDLYRPVGAAPADRTKLYGPQHAIAGRVSRAVSAKLSRAAPGVAAGHFKVFAEDGEVWLSYAPPPGARRLSAQLSPLDQNL